MNASSLKILSLTFLSLTDSPSSKASLLNKALLINELNALSTYPNSLDFFMSSEAPNNFLIS
ncbi:MAG: hypothetical protein CMP38_04710 [Rickettsiales bacterium]|nr:hypothetical protein [Rickettsiales bacterium]